MFTLYTYTEELNNI